VIRYDRENGRVWINGWRLHHGTAGLFLLGVSIALIVSDWHDRKQWLASR
jgi:hypothetical protein